MDESLRIGTTDRVEQKLTYCWYSLYCHTSYVVPDHIASCAAWRSRIKVVATAGGIVATKFAAAGRWQTCVQETGCQINQKIDMHHWPCDSPGLGGRRLRG